MSSKLAWKLFFGSFSVLAATLLFVYFQMTPVLIRQEESLIEDSLKQRLSLIRERLDNLPNQSWQTDSLDTLVDSMGELVQVRITVLDFDGRVLADSDKSLDDLKRLENHLLRPEIQDLKRMPTSVVRRYSMTLRQKMMYAATVAQRGFIRVALPMEQVEKTLSVVRRSILSSCLLAFLFSGILYFILSRYLTQTLSFLSDAASSIAKGDFSKRIHISSEDELGTLGKAINDMAKGLGRQFSELDTEKNQLITILDGMVEGVLVTNNQQEILLANPALHLMMDIKESCLHKTTLEAFRKPGLCEAINQVLQEGRPRELEITLEILEDERVLTVHISPLFKKRDIIGCVSVFYDVTRIRRLENMRREFVANVSHELKTPLTSIRGYSETLLSGALDDKQAARPFIEKIEKNALQLQNLVEDILKLSEIESGRMHMNYTPVALRSFVVNLLNDYEVLLKNKKITIENQVSDGLTVSVDLAAMKHILGNLVDNAIKYTPEGGSISIRSSLDGAFFKLEVIDTGIGIGPKDVPHVFERFYRVDKARSRQLGGTGLGLAIAKHLIQAQGGDIGVQSTLEKGSRFYFLLPLQRDEER